MMIIPAVFLILLVVIYTFRTGISPAPTTGKVNRELWKLLPEKVDGTVYELGSGWGTLAVPLARRYPHVVAYELSPLP